ncbi:MAG TPA: DUF488 domain-containing protein [Clostridia bacterium]
MGNSTNEIYTVGHSTRPIEEFIELLKSYGIEEVIDVRTIAGSKYNPQYNEENLRKSLEENGLAYLHLKELGGLRHPTKDSINKGWINKSFRGYADYMQTSEFSKAIEQLIVLSNKNKVVIMCAEAVPWKCHRSLIGDALTVRKIKVTDILGIGNHMTHKLTKFAQAKGHDVSYPKQ